MIITSPPSPFTAGGGGSGQLNLAGIDINLLLQEIRQLRIQLERTIDNNNLLRARLEEQLARGSTGAGANVHVHHTYQHTGEKGGRDSVVKGCLITLCRFSERNISSNSCINQNINE